MGDDDFRCALLNGIAWSAGLEMPADGVSSAGVGKDELEKVMDQAVIRSGKQETREDEFCSCAEETTKHQS